MSDAPMVSPMTPMLPPGDREGDYDPFEEFAAATGGDSMRDPYSIFDKLRAHGGLVKANPALMMGDLSADAVLEGEGGVHMAVGFDAVMEVLRDGVRFSSRGYEAVMGPVMGHTILEMDEPEHSLVRKLLQQAFSKRALQRWEDELVAPVIDGLIDRFANEGRAELTKALTFPFPGTVIAHMLGLPDEDHLDFHRWAVELIMVTVDMERAKVASQKLGNLFQHVTEQRRAEPRDDLITVLTQAEGEDGSKLDDEAISAFCKLLAPAGAETTYRSSSNLIFGLLSNREQWEALREDRSLMTAAIEEGLRWEAPLTGIMRTSTVDTEVEGVSMPAGTMVFVNMGAGNRDPARWENPQQFDIHRKPLGHCAFASGPHMCLGMHLARMETRVVIDALMARLPNLRLDPAADDVHISGLSFRSPRALPVVFD